MKPRYTQAQKEKAVTYYAEHNISITQACREMGYPHRDMLCAWIQEIRSDLLSRKQGSCKKGLLFDTIHERRKVFDCRGMDDIQYPGVSGHGEVGSKQGDDFKMEMPNSRKG